MKLTAALAAAFALSALAAVAEAQCIPGVARPVLATPPAYGPPVPSPRPMFFRHRRIQRPAPVIVVMNPAPVAPPVVAPPPADENGVLVLGHTALAEGQPVRVEWGAGYHNAQVVRVNADGTVLVHYTGWSAMWDESVPRHRMRLPR